MPVQIETPELLYGPYTNRLRYWSELYGAVLTTERDSETDFRYLVIARTDAVPVADSVTALLGVSTVTVLDYLDEMIVQGHEPPGESLISRVYFTITVGAVEYYVTPWQYLYQMVDDLT